MKWDGGWLEKRHQKDYDKQIMVHQLPNMVNNSVVADFPFGNDDTRSFRLLGVVVVEFFISVECGFKCEGG